MLNLMRLPFLLSTAIIFLARSLQCSSFLQLSLIQSRFPLSLPVVWLIVTRTQFGSILTAPVVHTIANDNQCFSELMYNVRNTLLSVGAVWAVPPSSWRYWASSICDNLKITLMEQSLPQATFADQKPFARSQHAHRNQGIILVRLLKIVMGA